MNDNIYENKEYFQFKDNNSLKKLLIQYKHADEIYSNLIFIKILKELSFIFDCELFENNVDIDYDVNNINVVLNMPILLSRIVLIKLMLNGLISVSHYYVNENYDLGIKLVFNIKHIQE